MGPAYFGFWKQIHIENIVEQNNNYILNNSKQIINNTRIL